MRSMSSGRAAAVALMALLLAAAPAVGDTEKGTKGAVGRHHLRDTPAAPGAECVYVDVETDMVLDSVTVRPPVLFARDRTDHRDRQPVAWRVVIMGWVLVGPWEFERRQLGTGPLHRALAWDDTRAEFEPDTVPIVTEARTVEVWVRMLWYRPGDPTTVTGRSRHAVDHYRVEGADTAWSRCIGRVT